MSRNRKKKGGRRNRSSSNQVPRVDARLENDTTPPSPPTAASTTDRSVPEPESAMGNDQSEVQPNPLPRKRTRSKGTLPPWRLEQLREAGRARGKQLKTDRQHQSDAGKARAARGDMGQIAKKGNASAVEKDPEHQSKARRGKRGKQKPKTKNNGGSGQGQVANNNSPQTDGEENQGEVERGGQK